MRLHHGHVAIPAGLAGAVRGLRWRRLDGRAGAPLRTERPRDAVAPSGRRGLARLTTLRGALAAMAVSALVTLAVSLRWLLGPADAWPLPLAAGTLTLELTALMGSLVNLVAVLGGCWDAVLRRRRGPPP